MADAAVNPVTNFAEASACLNEHGYDVVDVLGWGHFAACYSIRDRRYPTELFCAKVVALNVAGQVDDPIVTYEAELGTLIKLSHPNIITVYAGFSSPNYCYLILEYCERGTLRQLITEQSGLSEADFALYSRQLSSALAYLHAHNVCHRDIKPSNVLLDKHGRAKLADFGLAAFGAQTLKLCGSLGYMSPELLERRSMDAMANDVWALGVTFYEMIFGQRPWQSSRINDLKMQITSGLIGIPADIPAPVGAAIRKMLSLDPTRRPTMNWIVDQPFFAGVRGKVGQSTSSLPAMIRPGAGKGRMQKPISLTPKPRIITPVVGIPGPSPLCGP
jgi:BR serine/threonine kinase